MMHPVAQALALYAKELDLAAAGSGLTYLKQLRDKALAMLSKGNGQTFVSSTVNGQSFSASVDVTAADMFVYCQDAISEIVDPVPQMTYGSWPDGFPH